MQLTHIDCKDGNCKTCLQEHLLLGKKLEMLTGNTKEDHLGKYHYWLHKNGINNETEWGWASKESFDDNNINAYAEWFNKEG